MATRSGFNLFFGGQSREAQRAVKDVGRELKTVGRIADVTGSKTRLAAAGIAAVTGAAIAVGAALVKTTRTLAQWTAETGEAGDRIAKMSRNLAVGSEALQGWEFAAARAGSNAEQLDKGVGKLVKAMGDAAQGTKESVDLFKRLRVEYANSDGTLRTTEEVFRDVADAIQRQGQSAQTTADVMEAFGSRNVKLTQLLLEGSAGLDGYTERLGELGGILSGSALYASEQYQDATEDLDVAVMGLKRSVGEELLPTMVLLTRTLTDGAANAGPMLDTLSAMLTAAESLALAVGGPAGLGASFSRAFGGTVDLTTGLLESNAETLEAERLAKEYADALGGLSQPLVLVETKTKAATKATKAHTEAVKEAKSASEVWAEQLAQFEADKASLYAADVDRRSDAVTFAEEMAAADRRRYEEAAAMREEDALQAESAAWRKAEAARQASASSAEAWSASLNATASIADSVSSLVAMSYGEQSKEAKKAAKAAFLFSQAAALATAGVNLALGISTAAASAPTPYNIPAIAAAVATGVGAMVAIGAETIVGVADAGATPGMLDRMAASGATSVVNLSGGRNAEMILDPVGTRLMTRDLGRTVQNSEAAAAGVAQLSTIVERMLRSQSGGGNAGGGTFNFSNRTTIEADGRTLGMVVDNRQQRRQERGISAGRW